jgi:hypothetical protein
MCPAGPEGILYLVNKSENGERLIKIGNSNGLKNRIYCDKKTYNNFRLINAFRVENKLQIGSEGTAGCPL